MQLKNVVCETVVIFLRLDVLICRVIMKDYTSLQWRLNDHDGVSNHQPHDCLLNRNSGADRRKHQSSTSLAFVWGIHRGPMNSPHKWPVTRTMYPFDDVIMIQVWGVMLWCDADRSYPYFQWYFVNSLAPGGFENIFQNVFFKLISWIDTLSNSCETALRSMPQNPSDDQSTLVQVMAWCRQAASHYLSQCCPRSLSPYGVTRPQWVNLTVRT